MSHFEQSRREFLRSLGKGMVGAAALTAMPMIPAVAEGNEAPAWPWTWQKMDPQEAIVRGYNAFYSHGGCCAAAVAAVLEPMAEQYGYPYNQIDARMFANGAGGYGNQTLCGSLGGACAVLGLFCERDRANALRNELFAWYKQHEFPQYQPDFEAPYSVANSIQCADSVGTWMQLNGHAMGDPERLARCASLSGEVAAKVIELLNIEYGFEAAPVEVVEEPALAANELIGEADGFGGKIKVKVTLDGAKIAKVEVLENGETPALGGEALKVLTEKVVEAQSTEIDAVAGSTVTSEAFIKAVQDALSKMP